MIFVLLQFMLIALLILSANFSNIGLNYILLATSIIIGLIAVKDMKMQNLNVIPELRKNHIFINTGIYKYIRHPMYLAIFIFALFLVLNNISIFAIFIYFSLIVTLYLKSNLEEKYLVERFSNYVDYKIKTGRFFLKFYKQK